MDAVGMSRDSIERFVSCEAEPSSGCRWANILFVWGVWLMLLMAGLAYVKKYGNDVPYMDQWGGVSYLCSRDSKVVGWLWTLCNEHRMPLSKAIEWLSWQGLDGNLRVPMYLQVLALGVASAVLIGVARRIRGTTSATDAFFPLLLLHWHHGMNFLWSGQLYYVVAVLLYCVLVAYFAGGTGPRGLWATLGAALCVAMLPVQGGMGMVYAAPLSLAIACLGVAHRRMDSADAKRRGTIMLVAAVAAWVLMGLYLVGYHQPESTPIGRASISHMAAAAVQAIALGVGFLGPRAWPASGVVVVGLVLATLGLLFWSWKMRLAERMRVLTLLLASGAGLALTFVLGIGRANIGINAPRYIVLCAPLFCCLYLIWCLYGSPLAGRIVQLALFFVMCASLVHHMALGLYWGEFRQKADEQLFQDIAAGIPITGLVARSHELGWYEDTMSAGLELLREHRVGRYAAIQPDPPMKSRELSLTPSAVETTLEGDTWNGASGESRLTFLLDKPTWVYAVRLKFVIDSPSETQHSQFQVLWRPISERPQAGAPREESQGMSILVSSAPWTRTFWVNSTIDRFHISPGQEPFGLRLLRVELLERP